VDDIGLENTQFGMLGGEALSDEEFGGLVHIGPIERCSKVMRHKINHSDG